MQYCGIMCHGIEHIFVSRINFHLLAMFSVNIYSNIQYILLYICVSSACTPIHSHIIHDTCAVPYTFTYPNMMKHICIHTTHTHILP